MNPESKKRREIYPVTIVLDRYGGVYSGGKWVAYNQYFDLVPPEVDDGDIECHRFWLQNDMPVGRGNTPDEALADLETNMRARKSAS